MANLIEFEDSQAQLNISVLNKKLKIMRANVAILSM